jgi:hypothetical protein
MKAELIRPKSQKQKVLEALRRGGKFGILNVELNKICFRYGARIHELRREGYDIRMQVDKKGLYRFTLMIEREFGEIS